MKPRVAALLRMVLVVAAAIMVIGLADRHMRLIDVSRDARNSLTEQSAAVLELLSGVLEVDIVIPPDAPVARAVADFFARYQRHKVDFEVRFVDPMVDLEQMRELAANPGEVVIRYGGRSERLTQLSEANTTNALARLARGDERFITFLAANGERRVTREANHDLTSFGRHLKERGLAVHEFSLDTYGSIPDNTAVLVIASPAVAYTVSELDAINRYVARGGNLLWLSEPDQPAELGALGRALGVQHLPGTIVDPIGLTKLRNPAYAVAVDFAPHAVTEGFNQTLAMPFAAALAAAPNIDWQATALARSGPEAWTETGPYSGNVGFDAEDEVQGALTLVLALRKARPGGGEQRVIITGDGDFLSNAFVDNLGNRAFGRRLIEWLAADDALIDIAVDAVPDGLLDLAIWQRVTLFLFFAVVLPLGLAANGVYYWWRRRHA